MSISSSCSQTGLGVRWSASLVISSAECKDYRIWYESLQQSITAPQKRYLSTHDNHGYVSSRGKSGSGRYNLWSMQSWIDQIEPGMWDPGRAGFSNGWGLNQRVLCPSAHWCHFRRVWSRKSGMRRAVAWWFGRPHGPHLSAVVCCLKNLPTFRRLLRELSQN